LRKLTGTILLALLMVAAVFLSGFAAPEEAEIAENVTEITFGYQPRTHQIAYMTAMDKGLWAENLKPFGIEEISENQFPNRCARDAGNACRLP